MFERDHAEKLLEDLKTMIADLQKIAADELELQLQVNPTGAPTPISPEGVAILSARMQIMSLTNAVSTIGQTLIEILIDRAEEQRLGLQ